METWEVFRRHGHKQAFEHVGTVSAPDAEMALLLAKECFVRRREGEHLWIVNRANIHSFKDESLLELSADKSYRFPEAYRDVVVLRDRARQRAQQLSTAEVTDERDAG